MRHETKTLRYLKKTPSYNLTAHDRGLVAQHFYTGHTHAIVYFLKSVENPRCRDYCQELSRHALKARSYKTVVLGIAPEHPEALAQAHRELGLSFPLLSDPELETARKYDLLRKRWFGRPRVNPAVVAHDKYGIAYYVAIPENDRERPPWEEIEAVLRRFHRG